MCKVNTILFRRSLFLKKKERKEESKQAGRERRREENCLSKSSFTYKILYFIIRDANCYLRFQCSTNYQKKKKKKSQKRYLKSFHSVIQNIWVYLPSVKSFIWSDMPLGLLTVYLKKI